MEVNKIDLKILYSDICNAFDAVNLEASIATDEGSESRLKLILRTLRADEELLIKYIEQL